MLIDAIINHKNIKITFSKPEYIPASANILVFWSESKSVIYYKLSLLLIFLIVNGYTRTCKQAFIKVKI
jgi:hypothetical protein